jgi:hypothetical protein
MTPMPSGARQIVRPMPRDVNRPATLHGYESYLGERDRFTAERNGELLCWRLRA